MEIIAFPWGAACRAKILAVLRVRLIFRRARNLLLAHFVLALSCHILALSSLPVD
jgi:hypothetical protein